MRVAVAGWFGADNVGDEVLFMTTAALVREVDEHAEVVAVAGDPGRVHAVHGVPAQPLAATSKLGKATGFWDRDRFDGFDAVLLGPGTVFQERKPGLRWPGTLPALARVAVTGRRSGARVSVFGAGVREGGTAGGARILGAIARSCVVVGVRDLPSAQALRSPRTRVIGDVVSAWTPPPAGAAPAGDHFAVSARPGAGADPVLAAAVDHLQALGLTGLAFPFALGRGTPGEDDRAAMGEGALARLSVIEPPFEARPFGPAFAAWIDQVRACRIMVATRLHAAVIALALGVPVVAIPYERKVATTLTDLGLGGCLLRAGVAAPQVRTAIDAALSRPVRVARAQAALADGAVEVRATLRQALGA